MEPAFIAGNNHIDELEDWELEVDGFGGRWLDIKGQLMLLPWNIIEGNDGILPHYSMTKNQKKKKQPKKPKQRGNQINVSLSLFPLCLSCYI